MPGEKASFTQGCSVLENNVKRQLAYLLHNRLALEIALFLLRANAWLPWSEKCFLGDQPFHLAMIGLFGDVQYGQIRPGDNPIIFAIDQVPNAIK